MVERFGRTDNPEIAARTAMGCLLLPLPGPEGDAARLLAERAIALSGSHSVHPYAELASGLADYRAGRFDDAIARARASGTSHGSAMVSDHAGPHGARHGPLTPGPPR